LNKNPENNNENNDIDDILDILKKRKEDSKGLVNDEPTRLTNRIIVPDNEAFKDKKDEEQSSMFDNGTAISFDVVNDENNEKSDKNSKTAEIIIAGTDNNPVKSETSLETDTESAAVSVTDSAKAEKDYKEVTLKSPSTDLEPPKNTPSTTFSVMPEEKSSKPESVTDEAKPESIKKPVDATPSAVKPAKKATPRGNYDSAPKVSLEDFDSIPIKPKKKEKKPNNKRFVPGYVKVIIYLSIVLAVSIFISASIILITNDVFALTKENKEITVEIKEGATVKEVAKELKEKGVIKYSGIYKLYLKFRADGNMDGKFLSGTHKLNSDMNYEQIITLLTISMKPDDIVRVTIPEGYTVNEILDLLEEKKVIDKEGRATMVAKLNDVNSLDYKFLPEMPDTITNKDGQKELDTDKFYLLEGYLFPDTYDFYMGENIDSIIAKLLNNFESKFDEMFYSRCEDLGMTVDEVITLASMIQAEGDNSYDFNLISTVFHNRLNNWSNPKLESDATALYALMASKDRKDVTDEEILTVDSPYNTYETIGLPPGPVCNPGYEAIYAALYPHDKLVITDEQGNTEYIPIEYYFFYTASCNGNTYFSETNAQHEAYKNADAQNNPEELERLWNLYN